MFQKCPLCNGTGQDESWLVHNGSKPKCPTCNGKRIINTLTGNPPDDRVEKLPSNINEITFWGGLDKEIVAYEEDYKKDSLSASDFAKLFYGTFEGY